MGGSSCISESEGTGLARSKEVKEPLGGKRKSKLNLGDTPTSHHPFQRSGQVSRALIVPTTIIWDPFIFHPIDTMFSFSVIFFYSFGYFALSFSFYSPTK